MKQLILASVFLTLVGCENNAQVTCVVTQNANSATVTCPNGSTATIDNGTPGPQGQPGQNGTSSSISVSPASPTECPNGGQDIVVTNGGVVSAPYTVCNGVNPVSPVQLIAPCTMASSPWKEELVCLSNGEVLADFSDDASGLNTRLSLIPTGSYIDTDDSGCQFNVSIDNSGNTTVSWNAGSNQYATWVASSIVCTAN